MNNEKSFKYKIRGNNQYEYDDGKDNSTALDNIYNQLLDSYQIQEDSIIRLHQIVKQEQYDTESMDVSTANGNGNISQLMSEDCKLCNDTLIDMFKSHHRMFCSNLITDLCGLRFFLHS